MTPGNVEGSSSNQSSIALCVCVCVCVDYASDAALGMLFHSLLITDFFTSTNASPELEEKPQATIIMTTTLQLNDLLSPSGWRSRRTLSLDLDTLRLAL
jgi:hypothetical protein